MLSLFLNDVPYILTKIIHSYKDSCKELDFVRCLVIENMTKKHFDMSFLMSIVHHLR